MQAFKTYKIKFKVKYLFTIANVFLLLYVINQGVKYVPDSEGYLTMAIYRSPLYPVFLKLFSLIFSELSHHAIIIFQIGFGSFCCFYFANLLKTCFNINTYIYYFTYLILFSPYMYLHKIGNTIGSEALAYPLYLLIISQILLYINSNAQKHVYKTFLFLGLLLLTRSQFLYLIPILIIIFSWQLLRYKVYKPFLKNTLFCLLLPLCSFFVDQTYHYVKHGHFVSTPWTGLQVATLPFFVSSEADEALFSDPNEKAYFNYIFEQLKNQNLNINYLPDEIDPSNIIEFYTKNYTAISNKTISDKGFDFFSSSNLSFDETLIEIDRITIKISSVLILNNFKPWLNMYLKNFIHGFGTKKMALLWLFIAVIATLYFFKTNNLFLFFIVLISLSSLFNTALVAVAEHTIKRFLFYNDWGLFVILGILISRKKSHEQQY